LRSTSGAGRMSKPSSVEDVEGEAYETLPAATSEAGAEARHVGHAAVVEDDGFAVQHEIVNRQSGDRPSNGREPDGPVVDASGPAGASSKYCRLT